jgi:la-related protein 1
MEQAKRLSKGEWKTQFEAVMLEVRTGNFLVAEEMVSDSLGVFFATGRLWATLIQMLHAKANTKAGFDHAHNTFKQALNEIPKSGEVWCEGARIAMANHPENPYFDLEKAYQYFQFAVQFTPQYGDSFLELMRLCMMQNNMTLLEEIKQQCKHLEPNYGVLWFFFRNSVVENAM